MRGAQLMALMRPHLDSLGAMDAGQMAAAMPAHRDLAIRMMDAMGADMRGRSMRPDSAWSALSDSLRQDLGDLSTLRGAALRNRMQGHIGRMQRMMTVHQQMLGM